MNEMPLITVIVPVYNIRDYLPRCVHSITAQTYRRLEILLVDDGSTDGTGELCDALAGEDERIRVYHKKNGGTSSARNLALEKARGEYVGFVDSDDYIEPDMYERLMDGIRKFHVGAAQTGRDEIDEQGHLLPNMCEPPSSPVVLGEEEFFRELLLHRGDCSFCTKLIRRELFPGGGEAAGKPSGEGIPGSGETAEAAPEEIFPLGRLNEDFHLLVRMLPRMGSILSLPQQGYHVFYRMDSNSRRTDREDFSRVYGDSVENADMAAKIAETHYPGLREAAFRFGVFQRLEYLLHIPISQMTRENRMYRDIVSFLRRRWAGAMGNSLLTGKNKVYHTLFALSPRGIRKLHAWMRRNRQRCS